MQKRGLLPKSYNKTWGDKTSSFDQELLSKKLENFFAKTFDFSILDSLEKICPRSTTVNLSKHECFSGLLPLSDSDNIVL